jgi:dihydrofolate synthase/folylpolyglutamate synthase
MDGTVAVITPVGLDHTEWLGDTIAKIAAEKAGIIKPGATVVMSMQPPEAARVIEARAAAVGATVAREGFEYGVVSRRQAVGGQLLTLQGLGGSYPDIFLNLQGPHQASNAATALAAVESFLGGGTNGQLDIEAVREGFAAADSPGRLEVVRRNPTVLLDGAHNPAGAQALATAIVDGFDFTRLVGVIGVLADKDVRGVLEALEPVLSAIVVTQNASPRAMPAEELGGLADEIFGRDRVEVRRRLDDAIESAISIAEDETEYGGAGVIVFGSLVTVGEARTLLRRR